MTTEPVRPVSQADRTWATLGNELTPAKSLQRMDTATDRVVRTVTIIGTLLGGFGVFGATKPTVSGPARWITVGAVVCAAAAVARALADPGGHVPAAGGSGAGRRGRGGGAGHGHAGRADGRGHPGPRSRRP
ncbi:MAG TPA: hypothetical protein VIP48_14275, partial [Streptosporangiaceae bacterium]